MKRRIRDYQRSKLYKAERVLEPIDQTFDSIEDVRAFVGRICRTRFWRDTMNQRYRSGPVAVIHSGQGAVARRSWNQISLCRWAWRSSIVLHELAHIAAEDYTGTTPIAPHGREFARTFLALVGRFMGKDAQATLRASFIAKRVRMRGSDQDWRDRVARKRRQRADRQKAACKKTTSNKPGSMRGLEKLFEL